MSRMTWSARAIGTKVVTIAEVSLIKGSAIQIGDLVTNLNGILEGTFFIGELFDESTGRSDNRRRHLDHAKLS